MVLFLGDEGANPCIQAAAHVQVGGLPGQHHDLGHRLQALQALDDLHAIQAGQADVENDYVRAQVAGDLRHLTAIADLADDMEALALEQ
ncbi:hypothetical protein D3C79_733550 [compost metagenome]